MWKISNNYSKSKKKMKFFLKIEKSKWFPLIDNLILKSFLVHKAFTTLNKYGTRA